MRKILVVLFSVISLSSCMKVDLLYIHEPFSPYPVIEDDSVKMEFEYDDIGQMSLYVTITNKTDESMYVLWRQATIDSLRICFGHKGMLDIELEPQEIKPNEVIKKQLAVREYFAAAIVPIFEDLSVRAWNYLTCDVISPFSLMEEGRIILSI